MLNTHYRMICITLYNPRIKATIYIFIALRVIHLQWCYRHMLVLALIIGLNDKFPGQISWDGREMTLPQEDVPCELLWKQWLIRAVFPNKINRRMANWNYGKLVTPLYYSNENPITTLRSRPDGRPFPDEIFKCIFLNENVWISIEISLFVPKGPINNNLALVQIMPSRRPGEK